MIQEEFDAYVDRVERAYRGRPFALKCKVVLWLLLGYGFFLVWAGPLLVLAAIFLALSASIPPEVSLIAAVVGGLLLILGLFQLLPLVWMKWDPLQGVVLTEQRFPDFFERLEVLRQAARAKRFRRVIVTIDFNAAVVSTPRLGIFGWTTSDLMLGLPLLEALTPAELESVLMHEFAHHSAKHGRFSSWIYRVRLYWLRIVERFQQQRQQQKHVTWLLQKWLDWYWQRFHAHAFVLSRSNEYEADREAALWSRPETSAESLWKVECQSTRIDEKFWERLWSLAKTEPEPVLNVMARLLEFLQSTPSPEDAARWVSQAELRLTSNADTHPSLKDRLRALQIPVERFSRHGFPEMPRISSAQECFGSQLSALRQEVDAVWVKEVTENWHSRHGRLAAQARQIAHLEDAQSQGDKTLSETLWAKAGALFDSHNSTEAEQVLRELLVLDPRHSRANLVLGRLLLNRADATGEQFLLQVLSDEENDLIPEACDALSSFHRAAGRQDRVAEVHRRLSRYQRAVQAASQERFQVLPTDSFIPHELDRAELSDIIACLTSIPELHSAFLVRKELLHFTQQRLFVLCVHTAPGFFGFNADANSQLAATVGLKVKLPGRQFVIAPVLGFKALGKAIMKQEGARIV